MTTEPTLTDPPEDEPVGDWRSEEHQAEVTDKTFRREVEKARELLKAAGAKGVRDERSV